VSVFLLTALMVGMAGGVVAQGRYGVGASYGVSSLSLAGIVYNGGTFMINGQYGMPLDEKGLSVSFEPGIFATIHSAKQTQSGLSLDTSYTLSGFRLPVLLKQQVDSWFLRGGAYVDLIGLSTVKATASYLGQSAAAEVDTTRATNPFVAGVMGQFGYDFKRFQVMAGVTLPLTNVYKNVSSAPLNIGVGVSTTF